MGQVFPFRRDPHEETQLLLPWFLTDQLDTAEHDRVAAHLADCPDCAADLASERRMRASLADAVPASAGNWDALRERARQSGGVPRNPLGFRRWPRTARIGFAIAAQFAIVAIGIGAYRQLGPAAAEYHVLGTVKAASPGNIVVIFRPDIREAALRQSLNAVGARLVDGPTAADAYVLSVAPAKRTDALRDLRANAAVLVAQPIDAAASP